MGADMCLAYLVKTPNRKINYEAGHKYINKMKENENGSVGDDPDREYDRDALHGFLKDVEEQLGGRTTADIGVAGFDMYITGGMSWGDDPSELYTAICALDDADGGILKATGFNRSECFIDYASLFKKILKTKELLPQLMGLDKRLDEMVEASLSKGRKK